MTVNFTPAVEAMQYQISCPCGKTVAKQVFPSFEVAYKVISGRPIPFEKPVCDDEWCGNEYLRVRAVDEDELTVNMANTNASRVLRFLGLPTDQMWGVMNADEFLALVEGKADSLTGPAAVFVGLSEDYLLGRLDNLANVARYAAERGSEVVWG